MAMFHHDGVNFHYESMGEGLPVVFCHGLTGDLNQPKNMLVPLPGCRLILWDARAHGRTEPIGDENQLNFAVFADDLCALLDYLELDCVAVGGISMGAGVATRFAVDHPERVAQLFLVRPAWFDQR